MKSYFYLFVFFLVLFFHTPIIAQSPIQVAGSPSITAVSSGDWSETTTWGGSLPQQGDRVLIPAGLNVRVNDVIMPSFKSIRIAGSGTLRFAVDVPTELKTEFLVSEPLGRLELGTIANPIQAAASLIFADLGGTDTNIDPERFAPGAVLMGPVSMHGAPKTSYTTLQVQASANATSLELSTTPMNWQPGDQLVLAATTHGDPTSDDLVTIADINGNRVTLSSALQNDHKAPTARIPLDVHVANLTRNIKISSENSDVNSKRRGHIMFMHHLDVDMRYVELHNMGRTDKSIPLDDYLWDDLQESPSYVPPRGAYTNPRGRYSIHFHRGGFDPALKPAHVQGVTVNNDPGWAYVNHSSRVDFIENVSYDVVGGAFNTESGNETGSFIKNIALRSVNPNDPLANPRGEQALVDIREEFQDYAWQGCGYWFHSAGISVEDNIAAGVSGHAFIFWPEGLIENGLGMTRGSIDDHVTDPALRAALNDVDSDFVLECWLIPAKPIKNNTAYTVSKGLTGYYMQTRFLDDDEGFKNNTPPEAYRQLLNIDFDGFTIWNIKYKGIDFLYTSDVTIKNSNIIGYGSSADVIGMDLDHWFNLDDWFILNNHFEGFNNNNTALSVPLNAKTKIEGGQFDNSANDILIHETNFGGPEANEPANIGRLNRTLDINNITFEQAENNIVMAPRFTLNQEAQDGIDFGDEEKSIFYFMLRDDITLNYGSFNNTRLYFDQQAPDFIPITNANFQLEIEPGEFTSDVEVPAQFRNKTNAELQALTNPSTSFGGRLLPANAISVAGIVGGKVEAITTHTQEIEANTAFSLSPNPCSDVVEITGPLAGKHITICSATGQQMAHYSNLDGTTKQIQLGQLPAGIYFILIREGEGQAIETKKLIKH